MEAKLAKNEKKNYAKKEGLLSVIDGTKIKFNAHLEESIVLNNIPTTQGKLTETIVEKQFQILYFMMASKFFPLLNVKISVM
ncbi:hypothetical protein [Chryseobacterium turcicum]|uniref:Uncharacterized protein n=1 Tax=Chryseobacterium turcicum TaxID=2898076 RepID=A0A9Q3YU61_9FLAO|nr:hypothetical protein [Chryseobacterium turcicum]MCD1115991.1 hypothetical protein [Chryseobacterium turcicum]